MRLIDVPVDNLVVSPEMVRSRSSKVFEERLRASIEEMGLAEPLKVARLAEGRYLVVDGMIRLRAVRAIREVDPRRFPSVPAYVVDFAQRFEIRYQTDIYQDLLPSQLATLVEHLHAAENVQKSDIARFIGVSPATLRNYTGLWRLLQRGGLFASVVDLMDVAVFPASNPYAWLRLTERGIREAIQGSFSDGMLAEVWFEERLSRARRGDTSSFSLAAVETATGSLSPECYREDEEVRNLKRELGLRRAAARNRLLTQSDNTEAIRHLDLVSTETDQPALRHAAASMARYLQ